MSMNDLANELQNKLSQLKYPTRPEKPRREAFSNNAKWGIALDQYDVDMKVYYEAVTAQKQTASKFQSDFEASVLDDLGLTGHPKAGKLWSIAWSLGHSNGYLEVAQYAEMLSELLV